MNKKFKGKLKNKISKQTVFGFILGAIIFGTIGVGASTLLYGSDVTYDNSSSGMSATTVQAALDELYEQASSGGASVSCDDSGNCTVACKQGDPTITDSGYSCTTATTVTCPSGTTYISTATGYKCVQTVKDQILAKVDVVTSGDGLYVDSATSGRYIYRGSNVNNYITFNDEVWRIISVESDGTIKIIKQDSIGSYAWDTRENRTTANYCNYASSYGCNSWGSSTTTFNSSGTEVTSMPMIVGGSSYTLPTNISSLNTYLNGTYYNSLSSTAQSQIESHMFNIGVLLRSSGQTTATDVSQESAYKWKGKIALANASEYVRTSTNTNCTGVYAMYNISSCYNNNSSYNWMYNSSISYWWTLSPTSDSKSIGVWYVNSVSMLSFGGSAYSPTDVRPVLYLRSDITLSGSGTSSDPYTIN